MNILILGGGGREHALAWACAQNPACDRLVVAPGNPGIAALAECADLDILDGDAVTAACERWGIDLVIVGPEAPLAAGVADAVRAAGVAALGPSAAAARLESSKAFAREVCDAAGIPGPAWARLTEAEAAVAHIRAAGAPIVVKADGLAAGKGVTVAATLAEAEAAARAALAAPGAAIVIEEMLRGEEASLFVLCDGEAAIPFGTAQDHKRAFDGDAGPNTGGMGAYSPAPILTPELERRAMDEIVRPTLREMSRRGTPFQGVLYAGLMIDGATIRLVEYNVRLGDPEAQALMMRMGAQALDLMRACAEGRLDGEAAAWAEDHAMCVVLAAEGYPGAFEAGEPLGAPEALPDGGGRMLFHAGTAMRGGRLVSAGGRVLGASARGATLAEARDAAYALAEAALWPGGRFRRDIGARALR